MDGNGNQEGQSPTQTTTVEPGKPVVSADGTVTFATIEERNAAKLIALAKDRGTFRSNIEPNLGHSRFDQDRTDSLTSIAEAAEQHQATAVAMEAPAEVLQTQKIAETMMTQASDEGRELSASQAEDAAKVEALRLKLEATSGRKISTDMASSYMKSGNAPQRVAPELPQVTLKPEPWYSRLGKRLFGGQGKTSTAS